MLLKHCEFSSHCLQNYRAITPAQPHTPSFHLCFLLLLSGQMKPSVSGDSVWALRKVEEYSRDFWAVGNGELAWVSVTFCFCVFLYVLGT